MFITILKETESRPKRRNPARRRNEAFAQAFLERLAGSQGRALSRVPQDTESPLDSGLLTGIN